MLYERNKKTLAAHLTDHVARIVNHYLANPISPPQNYTNGARSPTLGR